MPVIREYQPCPPEIRRAILERDHYKCQDCGWRGQIADGFMDVHHILPYRMGGEHVPDNLITLCDTCHHKHDRDYHALLKKLRGQDKKSIPRTDQLNTRLPKRHRDLLDAFCERTGFTTTQALIQAIECLAEKYNVELP